MEFATMHNFRTKRTERFEYGELFLCDGRGSLSSFNFGKYFLMERCLAPVMSEMSSSSKESALSMTRVKLDSGEDTTHLFISQHKQNVSKSIIITHKS